MLLLSFVIVLQSLCSPNEDFGNPESILDHRFEHIFKQESPKTSTHTLEKVLKQAVQNVFRVSKIFVWGA
jgi:hypothetical protein